MGVDSFISTTTFVLNAPASIVTALRLTKYRYMYIKHNYLVSLLSQNTAAKGRKKLSSSQVLNIQNPFRLRTLNQLTARSGGKSCKFTKTNSFLIDQNIVKWFTPEFAALEKLQVVGDGSILMTSLIPYLSMHKLLKT